jgi:hypothetical protein
LLLSCLAAAVAAGAAATAGLPTLSSNPLAELAAVHPVAFAQLMEQCVRSPHFRAKDAPLAAAMLQQLCSSVVKLPGGGHLLGQPYTCAALASAVAGFAKWTGLRIRAAGEAQREPQQQAGDGAVLCFPAAVPALVGTLLAPTGEALCLAVQQQQHAAGFTTRAASSISDGSCSSSSGGSVQVASSVEQEQCRASAVLLAVLLARSLAVLTDAMEAAAVAADSTPAQLFTR